MNGVRVTRDGTGALIAHDFEPRITMRLELGPHADTLSEQDIVERYQQRVCALGAALVSSPQLNWDNATGHWRPRGRAIRFVVEASIEEPIVVVDDIELTVTELGAMLSSHGVQICLVFLDE
jgi:hypothetical protein